MSRLSISSRHLHTIHRHAAATYPEECCGILIGRHRENPDDGAFVERILSAQNAREDRRGDRFLIEPSTVLAAHKEARAADLDVVGYYHSHPDHPARPSDFDREHAWPGVSYVIVAVDGGSVDDTRSWRLASDRLQFEEEEIMAPGSGSRSKGSRSKGPRSNGPRSNGGGARQESRAS